MLRILLYIVIIIAGALISSKGLLSKVIEKNLSKLQYACLLLLLFTMGVNIGINDQIISTFGKLGFQAVVLALSSVVLSVAAVKLVNLYFASRQKKAEVKQDEH